MVPASAKLLTTLWTHACLLLIGAHSTSSCTSGARVLLQCCSWWQRACSTYEQHASQLRNRKDALQLDSESKDRILASLKQEWQVDIDHWQRTLAERDAELEATKVCLSLFLSLFSAAFPEHCFACILQSLKQEWQVDINHWQRTLAERDAELEATKVCLSFFSAASPAHCFHWLGVPVPAMQIADPALSLSDLTWSPCADMAELACTLCAQR